MDNRGESVLNFFLILFKQESDIVVIPVLEYVFRLFNEVFAFSEENDDAEFGRRFAIM